MKRSISSSSTASNVSSIAKELQVNSVEYELDRLIEMIEKLKRLNEIGMRDENEVVDEKLDKTSLEYKFDHLLASMESEEIETSLKTTIRDAKKDAILHESYVSCYRQLLSVIKNIRPFDISKCLELYYETEATSELVREQDTCLLMGFTGSGKSTTTHYLCGSQLKMDDRTGHIAPVNIKHEMLKKIEVSFKVAHSVTRFVTSVKMDLERDYGIHTYLRRNAIKKIWICDTPGFADTNGPEMDVANGLGIVKSVSLANRVKIILVITHSDFHQARFKGFKELCDILAHLLPNFSQWLNGM